MKTLIPFLLALVLTACGGGGGGGGPVPIVTPVTYKSTDWNATIGWWSDSMSATLDDTAMHNMVDHLVDVGYSGVTFAYGMTVDLSSGSITIPTITRMWNIVDYAYYKGLKVNLKLYWTTPTGDNVNQWNTPAGWFDPVTTGPKSLALLSNIDTYTTSLISTANAHHISMIILGSENDFLTFNQYHANWADIVSHIRSAGFKGVLTYDALYFGLVGENFYNVSIWDLMDKIGLSFYPDFSGNTLADLNSALDTWTFRTIASVTSSCAAINDTNTPTVSIVADLINIKSNWNKQIIFAENTYQDSQFAGMNWTPVDKLLGCNVAYNSGGSEQHTLVVQAQLEQLKTNLRGVVTGFNLMGYDPWEYGQTNGPMSTWKKYDQLTKQAAETMIKNYLQAGL